MPREKIIQNRIHPKLKACNPNTMELQSCTLIM